jgi:hypothetical protein
MVSKIISGGQTGADLGGLKAALVLGIKTSGRAPKGFKTEVGQNLDLKTIFGLTEDASDDYAKRTLANISSSDATLIFASNSKSPGTKLTIKNCETQKKPYLLIDPSSLNAVDLTLKFLQKQTLHFSRKVTLNIAGNRESKSPGIQEKVISILTHALQ